MRENMLPPLSLNELAREIHSDNVAVGWWDEYPNKQDRHDTAVALVWSELFEAFEGDRKDLMDDKLPQFKMLHVELADTMIRVLDLAGAYQIDFQDYPVNDWYEEETRENLERLGNFPNIITRYQRAFGFISSRVQETKERNLREVVHFFYMAMALSDFYDFDLWEIVELKREFNATRLDHKRSERAKPGGKKF